MRTGKIIRTPEIKPSKTPDVIKYETKNKNKYKVITNDFKKFSKANNSSFDSFFLPKKTFSLNNSNNLSIGLTHNTSFITIQKKLYSSAPEMALIQDASSAKEMGIEPQMILEENSEDSNDSLENLKSEQKAPLPSESGEITPSIEQHMDSLVMNEIPRPLIIQNNINEVGQILLSKEKEVKTVAENLCQPYASLPANTTENVNTILLQLKEHASNFPDLVKRLNSEINTSLKTESDILMFIGLVLSSFLINEYLSPTLSTTNDAQEHHIDEITNHFLDEVAEDYKTAIEGINNRKEALTIEIDELKKDIIKKYNKNTANTLIAELDKIKSNDFSTYEKYIAILDKARKLAIESKSSEIVPQSNNDVDRRFAIHAFSSILTLNPIVASVFTSVIDIVTSPQMTKKEAEQKIADFTNNFSTIAEQLEEDVRTLKNTDDTESAKLTEGNAENEILDFLVNRFANYPKMALKEVAGTIAETEVDNKILSKLMKHNILHKLTLSTLSSIFKIQIENEISPYAQMEELEDLMDEDMKLVIKKSTHAGIKKIDDLVDEHMEGTQNILSQLKKEATKENMIISIYRKSKNIFKNFLEK
jgi:hypothetical protein